MLQIVYISSARSVISAPDCLDILRKSRINNERANITGLLVAGQRRFLQALEGPTDAVRTTYARILADPRHYACVVISDRYLDVRQFGGWAMGFAAGGADSTDGAPLIAIVEALVEPLEDASLRAQFTGFAALQSRAA